MTDCDSLIRQPILQAFDQNIHIVEDQGDCRVMLPFRRMDGDPIFLYIYEESGEYIITDEGETHGMLLTSGVDIDSEKRESRVEAVKERFNLKEAHTEVSLTASKEQLGLRILDAYQAVQWIAFLVYTRRPYSPSYFKDKVASFLRSNDYQFKEDATVDAESEPQTVDFELSGLSQPTYLQSIQARNASDLHEKSKDTSWKWIKISRVQPDSRFVTMVDDEDGIYSKEKMNALYDDSDAVISWSERNDLAIALVE